MSNMYKQKIYWVLLSLLMFGFLGTAQVWNGKKCTVVLTYDDALNVHLDNAIPLLDSFRLKGSFYLSGYFPGCRNGLQTGERRPEEDMNWVIIRCFIPVLAINQEENG